jgi:hypothetical protein
MFYETISQLHDLNSLLSTYENGGRANFWSATHSRGITSYV